MERIQSKTTEYYKAIIALFIGSLIAFGVEYCVQPIFLYWLKHLHCSRQRRVWPFRLAPVVWQHQCY